MPWRICRIRDFTKFCSSVHSREEMAKAETANQLLALTDELESNLSRYRGVWAYDKYHPGFVDDMVELIAAVRRRIEDDDAWGAYDDWHRFVSHWDRVLFTPLWVQVGTVVVDGAGPTVEAAYNPGSSFKRHAKSEAVSKTKFEGQTAYIQFFRDLSAEVIRRKQQETGELLESEPVLSTVLQTAAEVEFDPSKEQDKDWAWKHYFELIIKNVEEKFGLGPSE